MKGKKLSDPDMPLFLSVSGGTASVGTSMFEKFKSATGVANPTANTLRKYATTSHRSDPAHREDEPEIMDHSTKVAKDHYDVGGASLKVRAKQWLDNKSDGASISFEEVGYIADEETVSSWKEREEEEKKISHEEAIDFMRKNAEQSNPVTRTSKQWNMTPQNRELLSEAMLDTPSSEMYKNVKPPRKFPRDRPGKISSGYTKYCYLIILSR